MKKPSSATIQSFIRARFVLKDDIGPFIPGTEITRLGSELMQTFEGIYCGAFPDKKEGKVFEVRSVKTESYTPTWAVEDPYYDSNSQFNRTNGFGWLRRMYWFAIDRCK